VNARFLPNVDFLRGARILVTGGTGSFGQAFVRRVSELVDFERVVVFSRDELKQYEMEQSFPPDVASRLRFFIGDVRDLPRLEMAMRDIDYVIHAAALKQVPAAEYNPFECIHTNVFGAENVVQAAIRNRVTRVIALSTDKASNPINLYGASKLASDKIFIAANHLSGSTKVRFAVVRYGNVVGSRGSVVPLFRRLICEGADSLPITDERMTRFWITLRDGVDFVLSCLQMMRGGEIFVPKIPSMRIVDLARTMAPKLPHRTVGIRPGEKLHETMITEGDARNTVEMADRYVIEPAFMWWDRTAFEGPAAKRVSDDFRYASDTNIQWLEPSALKKMLEDV
jgi:UDP-N-acetylglucosamine 4,6-dehydratase